MPEGQRGRGRPRDPTYDRAIREATNELLAREGYRGLTMSEVAREAGVAKTTIYRRWSTKAEMVVDAIGQHLEIPAEGEEAGDPVEALRRLVVRLYAQMSSPLDEQLPVAPATLLAEPEIVEAWRPRFLEPLRKRGAELVERAQKEHRIDSDVDPVEVVDILVAPAIYRAVALREAPDPDRARRLVDMVVGSPGSED